MVYDGDVYLRGLNVPLAGQHERHCAAKWFGLEQALQCPQKAGQGLGGWMVPQLPQPGPLLLNGLWGWTFGSCSRPLSALTAAVSPKMHCIKFYSLMDSGARQMSRAFCNVKCDSCKRRSWVCRTGCPITIRSRIMDSVWSPKSHDDALTRSVVAKEPTDSPGCCVSCQNS